MVKKIHKWIAGVDQAGLVASGYLINHIIGHLILEMNKTLIIYYKS